MPISDAQDNIKGTIVLGSPRSGTTLLRRLLDGHDQISCPGETFLFKGAAKFLEHDHISGGFEYGVLGGLEGLGYKREDVIARLRKFVTGFYEELARADNKSLWAAKTAIDSFYLQQIEEIFSGHVKFICILRHGLDVVHSMDKFSNDLQTYISEIHQYIKQHQQPYKAFAHAWCDITNALIDFAENQKSSCLTLRYETLVSSPEQTLKDICEFLEVSDYQSSPGELLKNKNVGGIGDWNSFKKTDIEPQNAQKWKNSLSPATIEMLAPIVNTTLKRAGYEAVEIDDEDSKRRHELAMMMMQAKSD
jgi:LPS sulfotransferase NodH